MESWSNITGCVVGNMKGCVGCVRVLASGWFSLHTPSMDKAGVCIPRQDPKEYNIPTVIKQTLI